MSEDAVLAALRRMGYAKDERTGHGFRSMAATTTPSNANSPTPSATPSAPPTTSSSASRARLHDAGVGGLSLRPQGRGRGVPLFRDGRSRGRFSRRVRSVAQADLGDALCVDALMFGWAVDPADTLYTDPAEADRQSRKVEFAIVVVEAFVYDDTKGRRSRARNAVLTRTLQGWLKVYRRSQHHEGIRGRDRSVAVHVATLERERQARCVDAGDCQPKARKQKKGLWHSVFLIPGSRRAQRQRHSWWPGG
jgi:hypothetical protein